MMEASDVSILGRLVVFAMQGGAFKGLAEPQLRRTMQLAGLVIGAGGYMDAHQACPDFEPREEEEDE